MTLRALSDAWTSYAPQMANHLWQSTLFVVLAALLAFALRKNQSRVRYWVWLTASVKFLVPFALLMALGSHLGRPRMSTPAQAVVYSAVEDFSQPFAGPEMASMPQAPAPVSWFHWLPPIAVAAWLAGIGVVLVVWATGWIRVSLMVRRAVLLTEGPEVDALRRMESRFGIRKPVRLVLSQNWMEPGIFGIFRPVLIWPEGISRHLDEQHVEAIVAHEICHARRHDNLTAVLHMLVEAVFWFHPLVWWMGARLEEERERACDEEVSLLCNEPHVYAESILRVCKFCSESPLACVSGITGADLKKRIVQIMTEGVARKLTRTKKLLLAGVAVCVLSAPVMVGMVRMIPMFGQILHADGPLPSFEVATIRPMELMRVPPPPGGGPPRVAPNGEPIISQQEMRISNAPRFSDHVDRLTTAKMLIADAYHLPAFSKAQIVGAPDWTEQTMYQLHAKIEDAQYEAMQKMPAAQQGEQVRLMEQSLLAARFQLKVHFEMRELPVYALQIAKGGPKLTPAKTESVPAGSAAGTTPAPAADVTLTGKGNGFELKGRGASPGQLIVFLQQQPELGNRLVIDKTGLTGKYDMTLDWAREGAATVDAGLAAGEAAPAFFTAIKEQLGLELVETKGPAEVMVIDRIEKPTVDGAEVPAPMPQPVSGVAPLAMAQAKPATTPTAPEQIVTASGPLPSFEVATIKPDSGGPPPFSIPPQNLFRNFNVTARDLVRVAYGLPPGRASARVFGGPSWIDEDRYDVEGKIPDAIFAKIQKSREMRREQMLLMVQSLLTERFKLAAHVETREMPIYELVVAKGGPKLTPSGPMQPGDDAPPPPPAPGKLPNPADMRQGLMVLPKTRNVMAMTAKGETMDDLSEATFFGLDRPVINKTGLTGRYDFTLEWSPGPAGPTASALDAGAEAEAPSFPTALEEQLGLRLVSTKGPVGVIVIDHIEKPSAN